MKRAVVFGSYIPSLLNFRGNLLRDLRNRGYEVFAMAPGRDEDVERKLSEMGVTFISLPLARTGLNPLADVGTLWFILKLFQRLKPEVLITYTIKPVIYGNLIASFGKIKTVALITGLGYLDTGERTLRKRIIQQGIHWLYKAALRKLQYVAFQNADDESYFLTNGLLPRDCQRTITAGSGVDLTYFQRAEPVLNPVTFLLVARLIKAKGIIQYIEAAQSLKKTYGERVVFQLVGMADEHNPDAISEQILFDLHKHGILDYKGFQKDVRPLLRQCSVFVLPSYYREGTPRTILEALAMGKPVITTDNPGCRDTVEEGSNGFIIPIKDTTSLQSAMTQFIEHPHKIVEMGAASYQRALNKYDVNLVNHHLMSFAKL